MKRLALISYLVFFAVFFAVLCTGTYSHAYELEKIFDDTREICCPMGLADVNSDGAAEWICLKSEYVEHRPKAEKRIYVYKFNTGNNKIETLWEGPDISSKDYLEGFDGKIYFGDLDGNGIQEIILIGWRFRADEETGGYPYEGNIYVFGWNGRKFAQELKTTKYYFSDLLRPDMLAITDVFCTGKDAIITNQPKKLFLLEKENHAFKERVLANTGELGLIDFSAGDVDNDGKNEIICGVSLSNENATKIYKYDGKEFEIIYQKTFVNKETKHIRIGDIRETKDGMKLITYTYDGKERYYKFIPKKKRYRGEQPEEWDNKLKEIEIKDPVFKEEPAKYPGLALPKGKHYFADLDGDGADELINCGPKGVSIYKIK